MSLYPWLRTPVYNGVYQASVSECRSVAANQQDIAVSDQNKQDIPVSFLPHVGPYHYTPIVLCGPIVSLHAPSFPTHHYIRHCSTHMPSCCSIQPITCLFLQSPLLHPYCSIQTCCSISTPSFPLILQPIMTPQLLYNRKISLEEMFTNL